MSKNSIVELAVILGIFTVVYFTSVVVVSKNFKGNFIDDLMGQKIAAIEEQAAIYGSSKKDLFKKENTIYMTIEELAKKNVIVNDEGVVVDPRNSEENLNNIKVKISNVDGSVTAKVLI